MNRFTTTPVADLDGLQSVIEVAQQATEPRELEPGKLYGWLTSAGRVEQIDLTGNDFRDAPKDKIGQTTVWDTDAFLAYFGKHSDPASEVYADALGLTVTAVLDAHTAEAPRWGAHRLHLELRRTKAWMQWEQLNGKLMDQEPFAEFLEDHLAELVSPPAAEMLEVAQSLQAASKVDFKSGVRLATGQRQLEYVETTTAKAGQKGTLSIPETFEIGLIPFEGSAPYRLTARFRYRINGGDLKLSFRLDRPEDVLKAAFGDVVSAIAEAVHVPVMNGRPTA